MLIGGLSILGEPSRSAAIGSGGANDLALLGGVPASFDGAFGVNLSAGTSLVPASHTLPAGEAPMRAEFVQVVAPAGDEAATVPFTAAAAQGTIAATGGLQAGTSEGYALEAAAVSAAPGTAMTIGSGTPPAIAGVPSPVGDTVAAVSAGTAAIAEVVGDLARAASPHAAPETIASLAAIQAQLGAISHQAEALVTPPTADAGDLLAPVQATLGTAAGLPTEILETLAPLASDIVGAVTAPLPALVDTAEAVLTSVGDVAETTLSAVGNTVLEVGGVAEDVATAAVDTVADVVDTTVSTVGDIAETAGAAVTTTTDVANDALAATTDSVVGIVETAGAVVGTVAEPIDDAIDALAGADPAAGLDTLAELVAAEETFELVDDATGVILTSGPPPAEALDHLADATDAIAHLPTDLLGLGDDDNHGLLGGLDLGHDHG